MATQVMFQEHHDALTGMVRRWDRRLRLSQTILWLPRSLLPGLAVSIVLAVVSRMRPWLMPQQIALVAGALVTLGVVGFALAVWLWRRPSLTSARRFDVEFRLSERVSTALELTLGTIHASEELALRQLEDARSRASAVHASEHIPLTVNRRDWVIAVVLAGVLALLLLLPNPQADVLAAASEQRSAIDNAADQVREAMQDVASDTSLGNEERQTLLEQLQTTVNTLEQPNISREEAFAALSDSQSNLQASSDELNRRSSLSQSALQQAADALRQASQQSGSPSDSSGQPTGAMEQVTQNLDQLAENARQMTEAERQQAAQALQNAAQSLQNSNPQAAQNLNDAAQQMQQQNLNQQQLQQALEQAQQQMQQQSQQAQQQQQSAQNMNDAAQQMQQSASQVSQQAQQQQQNQQAQQQQNGNQSDQNQQGQQNQPGDQQSQQNQQQGEQGQQGEPGSPQSAQQGNQNSAEAQSQQDIPGQGQQQSEESTTSQQAQSLSAGSQPGDQQQSDSQSMQQQRSQALNQPSNNPEGQGEGEFEAVNVPRRIGNQANDGSNVQLDPDASNAPVQEGDFSENPTGQVTIPYNQVFSDYANSANEALESDYVPLGLRDVVRDYFTSLEPRR
ncbi:MAG: hypothetical protein IT319_01075 [Anaerolineae bacterium]|nr:hypothetical protein [Anaerolineae bacterium]